MNTATADAAGGTTTEPRTAPLVAVVVLTAMLGASFAPGRPTALLVADVVLRMAFAGLVTFAASRSRPWSLVLVSGVALAVTGGWLVVPGAVVLAGATWTAVISPLPTWVRAAVGAVAVQLLLRSTVASPAGLSALVVAVAVLPLLVSAYRASSGAERRWVRRSGIAVIAFVALAAVGFGVAALNARGAFQTGINAGERGVSALEKGEDQRAAQELERSRDGFSDAVESLSAPWALPARVVPVLAQHAEAAIDLGDAASDVAGSSAAALTEVPLDELRPVEGQVDLARLEAAEPPFTAAADALEAAVASTGDVDDVWVIPPVRDRLDRVRRDLEDKLVTARRTQEALTIAPGLLGADGPRRYLVLFATPAESRALGGYAGAYGVLTANGGRLELESSGRTVDLAVSADPPPPTTEGIDTSGYGPLVPEVNLGNVTGSPDFRTVAAVSAELFGRVLGPFDGVLYVDPAGIASLLSLSGPVEVPGLPGRLDARNAEEFLLTEQYTQFPDVDERSDLLADVAEATFDRLTSIELPGPKAILDALEPAVSEGRFRFVSFDQPDGVLADVGLSRGFPAPDGSDLVALRTSNANPNKIDAFLRRDVSYTVTFDPSSGATEAVAEVTLVNESPSSGLPGYVIGNRDLFERREGGRERGSNTVDVTWITPLVLDVASVDGTAVPVQSAVEQGWRAHRTRVVIPPGGTRTVVFELRGAVDPGTYEVRVEPQAAVHPDVIRIEVEGTSGWSPVAGTVREPEARAPSARAERFVVEFARSSEGSG
jgi:hypothetical protein